MSLQQPFSPRLDTELQRLRNGDEAFHGLSLEQLRACVSRGIDPQPLGLSGVIVTADRALVLLTIGEGKGTVSLTVLAPDADAIDSAMRRTFRNIVSYQRPDVLPCCVTPSAADVLNSDDSGAKLPARAALVWRLSSRHGGVLTLASEGGELELSASLPLFAGENSGNFDGRVTLRGRCERKSGDVVWRMYGAVECRSGRPSQPVTEGQRLDPDTELTLGGIPVSVTVSVRPAPERIAQEDVMGLTLQGLGGEAIHTLANPAAAAAFRDLMAERADAGSPHELPARRALENHVGQVRVPHVFDLVVEESAASAERIERDLQLLGFRDIRFNQDGLVRRMTLDEFVMPNGTSSEIALALKTARGIAPRAAVVYPQADLDMTYLGETNAALERLPEILASDAMRRAPAVYFELLRNNDWKLISTIDSFKGELDASSIGFVGRVVNPYASRRELLDQNLALRLLTSGMVRSARSLSFENVTVSPNRLRTLAKGLAAHSERLPSIEHLRFRQCTVFGEEPGNFTLTGRGHAEPDVDLVACGLTAAFLGRSSPCRIRVLEMRDCIVSPHTLRSIARGASRSTLETFHLTVTGDPERSSPSHPSRALEPQAVIDTLTPRNFPVLTDLTLLFGGEQTPEWKAAIEELRLAWGGRLTIA